MAQASTGSGLIKKPFGKKPTPRTVPVISGARRVPPIALDSSPMQQNLVEQETPNQQAADDQD